MRCEPSGFFQADWGGSIKTGFLAEERSGAVCKVGACAMVGAWVDNFVPLGFLENGCSSKPLIGG